MMDYMCQSNRIRSSLVVGCFLKFRPLAQIASQKGVEPDDMEDFKKVDLEMDLAESIIIFILVIGKSWKLIIKHGSMGTLQGVV